MPDFKEFFDEYLRDLKACLEGMDCGQVEKASEWLLGAYREGKTIFVFGNGGSAATASHFVCDLAKGTAEKGRKRFRVIGLNDCIPLLTAWSNDSRYEDCFAEQLENLVQEEDLVIAISASGNSPNVLRAVETAKAHGAKTVGLTGFGGGKLAKIADTAVVVPSDSYERVEDVHLVLEHVLKLWILSVLAGQGKAGGARK